jgi:Kef-type K+ transport system membrane component KefB
MNDHQALIPMAYLLIAIGAACLFHWLGVPDVVGGIVIGAAMTRVKQPAPPK